MTRRTARPRKGHCSSLQLCLPRGKGRISSPSTIGSGPFGEMLKTAKLLGNSTNAREAVSGQQTALRDSLEVINLPHPAGQWVPSGTNLVFTSSWGLQRSRPRQRVRCSFTSSVLSSSSTSSVRHCSDFRLSHVIHDGGRHLGLPAPALRESPR